jgi:hypothetical protein
MANVIDLAQQRRQRGRRAYRIEELPVEVIEMIRSADIDPRHDPLNQVISNGLEEAKP